MRRADLITGLVVAALGAYALSLALDMALWGANHVPGAGFFPRLLSGLLLGLGLVLAVTSLRRPAAAAAASASAESEQEPETVDRDTLASPRRLGRAGLIWLCYAVCAPLLAVLGFVPTTAMLVFVLLFAIEGRRNWRALVVAILIPTAISFIFVDLLTIPLPSGALSHGPFGI